MKVVSDVSEKIITVYTEDIDSFISLLDVITDVQLKCAGYKSKRQKEKQLMDDMEQQIAELLSDNELE